MSQSLAEDRCAERHIPSWYIVPTFSSSKVIQVTGFNKPHFIAGKDGHRETIVIALDAL